MRKPLYRLITSFLALVFACGVLCFGAFTAAADNAPLISTVEELTGALMNAKEGDTILVGDITFKPMPMGMFVVPKNVTIKSGKDGNAVFTNATIAYNGTTSDSAPLTVRFENIDFRGDHAGTPLDPEALPTVSSALPDMMKTMCAAIFKMNVDATYVGCTFEGYHYGYGGVINAIYSSEDNKNALKLTLEDCIFRDNASGYGGSLYLIGYDQNITLDARSCLFEGNVAASTGGAIWAEDAVLRLSECTFMGNRNLSDGKTAPTGGALALSLCGAEMDGCVFANNCSAGDGAAVFCELSPFKAMVMKNCTLFGNNGAHDEGISLALTETKYDTPARAYVNFCSLLGKQNFSDHAELFGCLTVADGVKTEAPDAQNGYCLTMTCEEAKEKGIVPGEVGHVSLFGAECLIPEAAIAGMAGGAFRDSLAGLFVGDNFRKEITVRVEKLPGQIETFTVPYEGSLVLQAPEREGYSFAGWEFPKGTPFEGEKTFYGGEFPDATITARWEFVLSEHLYLIWIPLAVIAAAVLLVVFFKMKSKKKNVSQEAELPSEETAALPEGWVDRVCEKPEITQLMSKREVEVLHKLLEGKSRKQIAEELFVTEATIRKHSTSIYSKLNVHNRTELIYKMTKQ